MQPQNPNQNPNLNPGQPNQPGQPGPSPFNRRPIQPIAPRPFASPQQQTSQPAQNTQPYRPQPQFQPHAPQFRPAQPQVQPQPPVPQEPKPAASPFVRPSQPIQPTAQPHRPATQQASSTVAQDLGSQRPAAPASPFPDRPSFGQQTDSPSKPVNSGFSMSLDFQAKATKKKRPIAALIILALGIGGLTFGLIDKSQHSVVFNVVVALNLLAAFGLLFFRKEPVRKAASVLAIATVTVSAALALGYRGLADSTVKAEAMFISEAKKLQNQSPTKQLTHEQQQHLDAMQLKLQAQQEAIGENSSLVYAKYGSAIAAYSIVALYLTRPKVKQAFASVKSDDTPA